MFKRYNVRRYILVLIITIILIFIIIMKNYSNKQNIKELEITEVCTHNETIIYDSLGNYYDYVELYNTTDKVIDLSGYYLSDSNWRLMKYSLSGIKIEPKQYQVVFINADKAGFSIANEEVIFLSHGGRGIIDSVVLPEIEVDKSYAKNIEENIWNNNQLPTPYCENKTSITKMQLVEDPSIKVDFSCESGFYPEKFYLEMNTEEGFNIFYTLDGTEPSCDSLCYDEPILIEDVTAAQNVHSARKDISLLTVYTPEYSVDKCNIVRAIAVSEDGRKSEEKIASYWVGYQDKYGYDGLYIVSLMTEPENLFSDEKGIYVLGDVAENNWFGEEISGTAYRAVVNYTREGRGWKKPAYVEIFDTERRMVEKEEIRISIHGGFSNINPQKGFNLLAPLEKEGGTVIFDNVLDGGYTSLMLRPGGIRDWSSTQFRDVLNAELVEDRNVTVLQGIPCHVFLDGEYWGLYNLQERIDRGLIARNFGVEWEDVLIIKNDLVVEGNDEDYSYYEDMMNYVRTHDLSLDIFYHELEEMIDIQSYIDYNCFQIYVANSDSIANNYSCWRTKKISGNPYCDGKWRWIIYDTDDSTGIVSDLTIPEVDSFNGGHWEITPMEDPLFSALLENEEFKQRFIDTFVEMADMNFDAGNVSDLIDKYCDTYMQGAVLSRKRFVDPDYTEEMYIEEVNIVRDFFLRRKEYILEHMDTVFMDDEL